MIAAKCRCRVDAESMRRGRLHRIDSIVTMNSSFLLSNLCSVCCPYPFLAIPGVLSFIAMTFTWLAAIDCNFYKISYQDNNTDDASLHVGLWTVETRDYDWLYDNYNSSTCTVWEDYTLKDNPLSSDDLDGAMKTARAFGMASGILSVPAFVMIMIPACVSFGEEMHYVKVLAGILILLGIFTILDLVSEYTLSPFFNSLLKASRSSLHRLPWLPISVTMRRAACFRRQAFWRLWPRCCGS